MNTAELTSDLKRVVRDSEELLHSLQNAVGDKAKEVRERLSETLRDAKRTCRQLEEKAVEGARATDRIIRDHPYKSLGVAFGVGVLLGVLVMRK